MVVTIVAAVSALGMLFFAGMYTFWPLVAMALGVYIVFRALRPRHA
jgi:hypothetical protein